MIIGCGAPAAHVAPPDEKDLIIASDHGPILRSAIGIGIYAAAFGATFGAISTGAGLSTGQTMVLSLVMFSGASQLAFVGVAAASANPLAAVPAALLLAVRNAFYGVPVAEILHPRGLRRLATAHFVIDETTAMAVAQESRPARRYAFWATGLILCVLWNVGTLGGALVGQAIDPGRLGLDAGVPAVFLALLWPRLREARARWVAVGGAALALSLVPLAPAGVPVISAAVLAVLAGLRTPRVRSSRVPTRGVASR